MKHLKENFILIALALVSFNSCTTTKMSSSWREPDKSIVVENLRKVLVVALLKDETSRRKAEDQMAGFLKGRGVVSYNYLSERFNENNEGVLRKKIKDDGFDGALYYYQDLLDRNKCLFNKRRSDYLDRSYRNHKS